MDTPAQEIIFNKLTNIKNDLLNKKIPASYPHGMHAVMLDPRQKYFIDKFALINISAFVPVALNWVLPLARFIGEKTCLEIMAGKGVLAQALHECGVHMLATDDFSWKWHRNSQNKQGQPLIRDELWHNVEDIDALEAVKKYPQADFILCACPPFGCERLYHILRHIQQHNPTTQIIYIGETKGGCHAENKFFNTAKINNNDYLFNLAAKQYLPWPQMREELLLI